MIVAACKVTALLSASHSLKEKRAVVRRLKAVAGEQLHVPLAEVGAHDLWQRVELGAAVASGDHAVAERILADVVALIAATDGVEVIDVQRQLGPFDGQAAPLPDAAALGAALARTGAGDKARGVADAGGADASWVPAAWQQADQGEP